MSREIVNPEGLRLDGRRPREIRRITCEIGLFHRADGSAFYTQGNTKVIASIYGPQSVQQRFKMENDRCIVECEFTESSFSRSERRKFSKGNRKSKEAALSIKKTFESVILTHLYPRTQINIFVQVLTDDGGAISAAFNAVTLALVNAGIPMKAFVTGCSAGFVDNTAILDINSTERAAGGPVMHMAIHPKTEKVAYLSMENKLLMENFEDVMELAVGGCKKIHQVLKQKVQEYSFATLHTAEDF